MLRYPAPVTGSFWQGQHSSPVFRQALRLSLLSFDPFGEVAMFVLKYAVGYALVAWLLVQGTIALVSPLFHQ